MKKPSLECDKRFHTNFKKKLARGTVTKVIIKILKMPNTLCYRCSKFRTEQHWFEHPIGLFRDFQIGSLTRGGHSIYILRNKSILFNIL